MQITANDSLIDLVERNPYLLLVIEHLGKLDYPKNGTINDFCKLSNLPLNFVVTLINIYNNNQIKVNLKGWGSEHILLLIDFLASSHHYFKKEKYPLINSLLAELTKKLKSNETKLLTKFFDNYFIEVKEHLDYEEDVVFPYVKNLLLTQKKQTTFSIEEYQEHHNDIEEKLSDLKTLLMHHVKFGKYSHIGRQIIFHLFELEYDLHAHSKIEETLLIPLIKRFE